MRRRLIIMVLCLIIAAGFCCTVPGMAQERDGAPAAKQVTTTDIAQYGAGPALAADVLHSAQTAKGGSKVYWVASGKVYHRTKDCRTLARSKKIYSGTVKEAKAAGKTRKCKVCY